MKKYTSIDLFAGVGGISLGLEWSGFEILFANEFDTEIGQSFQNNFPNSINYLTVNIHSLGIDLMAFYVYCVLK